MISHECETTYVKYYTYTWIQVGRLPWNLGASTSWKPQGLSRPVMGLLYLYLYLYLFISRSQWPRGLSCSSAASRLLRLWVRISPGAWMSVVSIVCCQVNVSATSWSPFQRSPTDCGASLCMIEKPREWGGHDPLGGRCAKNKQTYFLGSVRYSFS
jgi:hypothetical protein